MCVNQKPKIQDESHGMWRRIRLIPFAETFGVDRSLMPTLEPWVFQRQSHPRIRNAE
jgi:phage/plasmid-associated DNA primase